MICLALTGRTLEENYSYVQQYRGSADLFELRVDTLDTIDPSSIIAFSRFVDKPMVLTCRRERDGGRYARTDRTRGTLLVKLLEGNFSFLDIEEDFRKYEIEDQCRKRGIAVIRSIYDTSGTPGDLYSRIDSAHHRGEIPKAEVAARSVEDVITVFNADMQLSHIPRKIIIASGQWGIPTRLLYKRTGSFMTYASPADENAGAPDHASIESMKNLYRCDRVTGKTKIFGVIGNPVMHTASPRIHNPAFHELGIDGIYVPFMVDEVRSFFKLADILGILGFSVTVPHKQHVLPYLGSITREVKQIGSCNTVIWERECWKGINTDYYGFLKPVMDEIEDEHIKRCVVIGAGGAARSVVWALRNHRCSVTIVNRTAEKAQRLARETGSSWVPMEESGSIPEADLLVQTTSLGMEPDTSDALPHYRFTGKERVYELVYKPKVTPLLSRAMEAGCRIIYGRQMLIAQGMLQFESFTSREYPFPDDAVVF